MYLVKGNRDFGYVDLVPAANGAGLKWISLGLLRLQAGASYRGKLDGREAVLVLLRGTCKVQVAGQDFGPYTRQNVFAERATAVYVPVDGDYIVTNAGEGILEVAVCQAVAEESHEPFAVLPEHVETKSVGEANFRRDVHDIVVKQAEGKVHRIIVGETFNPPGNWSSYPPHKHDEYIPGVEACMEEIYYYQCDPENGFGMQSIYTSDGAVDETFRVQHGDAFLIPRGYHPVCAAGGYQLYYLWLMAGPIDRTMIPHDDPNHAWVRERHWS
ncbi:5-deoxy-glucuronate isomerase [Alicyclobacillus hesperidum subsp. aegles]|uniref:5-deoxy-glucuronate isomerase n=1 Tax=Alicyclobacillus hesperidum TaxID=89784 RepID=UPI00222B9E7A|nr:5-deoxy-glucuronate isomerase [Alicyclobacillus hesperidum]GLG00678.1 5-deoxy-glucuronate isomerase [Alicyclobacillus hesperidum subsp. aegles]